LVVFRKGRSVVEARLEDAPRVNPVVISRPGTEIVIRRAGSTRYQSQKSRNFRVVVPSMCAKCLTNRIFQPCPMGIKLDVKHITTIWNAE